MPWSLHKRGDQTCVVSDTDGKTVKCYGSRKEATDLLRALYANVPDASKRVMEFVDAEGNVHELDVEIAADSASRVKGLSGRDSLRSDGMLFDFGTESMVPFTAKACRMDLDAQFFTEDGEEADSLELIAGQEGPFWSKSRFRYVLESPRGLLPKFVRMLR